MGKKWRRCGHHGRITWGDRWAKRSVMEAKRRCRAREKLEVVWSLGSATHNLRPGRGEELVDGKPSGMGGDARTQGWREKRKKAAYAKNEPHKRAYAAQAK